MKIDEVYSIKRNGENITLIKEEYGEINEKTGNPTKHFNEWYYRTIEQALDSYLNKTVDLDNNNIRELVDESLKAFGNIKKFLRNERK